MIRKLLRFACFIISKMPLPLLVWFIFLLKEKHVGVIMYYKTASFSKKIVNNDERQISKIIKRNKYMLFVNNGQIDVFFTTCYYCNTLSLIFYALSLGFIPVFSNEKEAKTRLWLKLFKQPSDILVGKRVITPKISRVSNVLNHGCGIDLSLAKNYQNPRFICARYLAHKFTVPNKYLEDIISDKQIFLQSSLGVIIRGTDYTNLKPFLHPVQPTPVEMATIIINEMNNYNYSSVFIATEDRNCFSFIRNSVEDKIKVFSGSDYYVSDLYSKKQTFVNEVVEDTVVHENNYLRNLFSLLNCHKIMGANSGGMFFVILNIDDIKKIKLLDFGVYR